MPVKFPMSVNKLLIPCFTIPIVLITFVVFSAYTEPSDFQLKPESILREVKSKSARAVVKNLYDDSNVWNSILQKIATGDRLWLEVAVALRPGSDAGSSEMLTLAVGEALENNPTNVLQIASKAFELRFICGGPDVDDPRYNSYELSMKAINHRIKKLTSIKDQSLTNMSKECIQYLEESKKGITKFYQMKTK